MKSPKSVNTLEEFGLTFEQAQGLANEIAASELEVIGLNCPEDILSQTYIENEGCWIFFMSEAIEHVNIATGHLFGTAYAIAKSSEMSNRPLAKITF